MIDPNLLVGIIGLIIAFLSLYSTYYFFNKGLREKKPFYTIMTRGIIGNIGTDIQSLKIFYEGKEIKNLSESRIAFWNGGKETILHSDVPNNDKIRIKAEEGYSILSAKLLFAINDSNNYQIHLKDGEIEVTFDHIDYQEGCSIQFFHTGKTSWSLKVTGSVIGAGKVEHAKHIPFPKRRRKAFWISVLIFILCSISGVLIVGVNNIEAIQKAVAISTGISFLAYAFLPLIISYRYTQLKKTSLILEVQDDDEILKAPDFPPTGRVRERNKDADPTW